MMKRMGSLQEDSDSKSLCKLNGVGWIVSPPKASLTKRVIADSSLSGLVTFMIMSFWNGVTLVATCSGNSVSAYSESAKVPQI